MTEMLENTFALIREDFPFFRKNPSYIYLDSAATAHKPDAVINAISSFYQEHYSTVHRAAYSSATETSQRYTDVRNKAMRFINAKSPSEIVFTRGTTDGLNIIARSFGKRYIESGDEIIISEMEHHSNIVPWQIMAEERGAKVHVIRITEAGELDLDHLKKLLSKKTKIVSVTHMSNVLGTINPIKEIASLAHDAGAYVCVDGAQSVSHVPINVQDLDADFFAFSGHKLMGPTGVGVLYGKEHILEELPPVAGGGDSIVEVMFEKTLYQKPPLKFEPGTPPIASVLGLGALFTYITKIGLENIFTWDEELKDYAENRIREIPHLHIIGRPSKRGGIFSFHVDDVHPLDLAMMLDANDIAVRSGHMCAQPLVQRLRLPGLIRVSLGCYNKKSDLDRFAEIAKFHIDTLRKR